MDTEVFLGCACELLAIPSTSERPAELRRALDYVLDFTGPGFTVERFESGGKPSALVYPGTERRDFHVTLTAHLDAVPAPPDQFRPRRDGDRLFARGAQDMKVTGLLAAQVFRELAASLRYPVALQLVTDEEVGGRDGAPARPRGQGTVRHRRRDQRIAYRQRVQGHAGRAPARGGPRRSRRLPVAWRQRPGQAAAHGGQPARQVSGRDRGGLAHDREPRPDRNQERGPQPGARRRGGAARHPFPGRRRGPERQDRRRRHRLLAGFLRTRGHAGGGRPRPAAPRRPGPARGAEAPAPGPPPGLSG